jgi:soluble epoxide hydrolase/lipid-phosphate phosphatase
MADIAVPDHACHHTVSTHHSYSYVYISPKSKELSTILLLHGFPSSCYDWRHQIDYFSQRGYGILAPDLLGFGGSSKPNDINEYRAKVMANDVIELLDQENIERVHVVGHDTGCLMVSRLANYHSDRLLTCTFLAVPYSPPGEHFDLDAVNAIMKQVMGYERFGYLRFFVQDDAGTLIDEHVRVSILA